MLKRILIGAFTALTLAFLLPTNAMAAKESDNIRTDDSGNITLISNHAAKDSVTTLQLSLEVKTDTDAKVSFEFSSENNAEIAEYRYHPESNCLNIYICSSEPLFDSSNKLNLGTVSAKDKSGNPVSVNVNAVDDSLKYVYHTNLVAGTLNNVKKGTGDINQDGSFRISDAVLLQKYLLGTLKSDETFTKEKYCAADLDGDGSVDSNDMALIRRMLIEQSNLKNR
jgi:dockerin type I repeat./ricin-type beta-trefoil lectin domain